MGLNKSGFDQFTDGESVGTKLHHSPSKAKKELERDSRFQSEMRYCLKNLEQMPKLRQKVFEQLGQANQQWADQKGQEGMIAGLVTRKRLVERRKEMEAAETQKLDKMIEMTVKESAI